MYLTINISPNKLYHYSLISQVNMQVNKQNILQKQLKQEISYELDEKDKNASCSVVLKHTTCSDNVSDDFGNTLDVSRFLNFPYEELHLKLYPSGTIKKVLNQREIAEKWNRVKKMDEFRQLLTFVDEEQFFRQMDPAYEDSLFYVQQTPHYIIFFPPVYRTQGYYPNPFVRLRLLCDSILFVGNDIWFEKQFELDRIENGYAYLKSKTLNFDIDKRKMKKLYKNGYASVIQSPIDEYIFSYEAEYQFDVRAGQLIQANAVFKEQANENLIYENKINIQLKQMEQ